MKKWRLHAKRAKVVETRVCANRHRRQFDSPAAANWTVQQGTQNTTLQDRDA
jgi:hypothetical protein